MWWVIIVLAVAGQVFPDDARVVDLIENVNIETSGAGATRIVSGWESLPGQHPHQVSLRMVGPSGDVSACGGSVIHDSWVLSAAHCTAGRTTIVVSAGVTNLTSPEYISETSVWFNHPLYNDLQPDVVQRNDLSLIRVERMWFTVNLQPIRVQRGSESNRDFGNQQLIATGFGRVWSTAGPSAEVLRWVYLNGLTQSDCFFILGSIINNSHVCARYFNVTTQGVCHGDSGGPLVQIDEGRPTLVGVLSFVQTTCHRGAPGAFIRPGHYHQWLTEVTGINFEEDIHTSTTTLGPPTTTTFLPIVTAKMNLDSY